MDTSQKNDLYVSWLEYRRLIEALAVQVYDSSWTFDHILCLARGGLRIGDLLSRIYNVPLAVLSVSSYQGEQYRTRGQLQFAQTLTMSTPKLGDRLLLVDDLVDSGHTLLETVQWLQQRYRYDSETCRTAVLWYKSHSQITPDYFVEYLAHNPWIHQPFELYENEPLEVLVQSYKSQGRMLSAKEN